MDECLVIEYKEGRVKLNNMCYMSRYELSYIKSHEWSDAFEMEIICISHS